MDSVRALGNLTLASRYVHQCFKGRKHDIIWRVLQNELGPVLADARFLRLFPYMDRGDSPEKRMAYWDGIHNMAAVYRAMLGSDDETAPSVTELTQLFGSLHKMNFLTSTSPLARGAASGVAGILPDRRQIVCNAWAPTSREAYVHWMNQDTAAIGNTSEQGGERLGLFAAFQPWELQQVDHADWFVTRLCAALALAGEEAGRPMGEAEFGNISSHADHLVQQMREHPSITDTVLQTLLSPSQRRGKMCEAMLPYSRYIKRYSLLCLQVCWQSHRLASFPDPARDHRGGQQHQEEEKAPVSVNFMGDAVDLAAFGWVDALDGRHVNWFGDALVECVSPRPVPEEKVAHLARYLSLERWRGAGFAMWDRRRVEAIRGLCRFRTLQTGWLVY
ncbi:hypothetical protein MGU_05369 [Metarhizium guizhouense ARSEF 977]|uniref:Uncharacterized protein n=1 Tax=Metarhizium guizhouense (strain ARSEF 977) TaxID=1276136 RepID=A0A0B4GKS8_METGA|nr:hypothetical protein MGU_05369 [Metarhizium guizhouense ARSEF 977]